MDGSGRRWPPRRRWPTATLCVAVILVECVSLCHAHPWYVRRVPNGEYFDDSCAAFAHVDCEGHGGLTPFAHHFHMHGSAWTRALCELDSDLDGWSNGEELGDPCCQWRGDDAALHRMDQISNPADKEWVPSLPPGSVNCSQQIDGVEQPSTLRMRPPLAVSVHVALMSTAFALLIPLSAVLARVLRQPLGSFWFTAHWLLVLLAIVLSTVGYAVVVVKVGGLVSVHHAHAGVGLALLLLLPIHSLIAAFRPPLTSSYRRFWWIFHALSAILLLSLSLAVMILGASLLDGRFMVDSTRPLAVLFASFGAGAALCLVEELFRRARVGELQTRDRESYPQLKKPSLPAYLAVLCVLVLGIAYTVMQSTLASKVEFG